MFQMFAQGGGGFNFEKYDPYHLDRRKNDGQSELVGEKCETMKALFAQKRAFIYTYLPSKDNGAVFRPVIGTCRI